jgi:hypothetical protein
MISAAVLAAIFIGVLGVAYFVFVKRSRDKGIALAAPVRTGGGFRPQTEVVFDAAAALQDGVLAQGLDGGDEEEVDTEAHQDDTGDAGPGAVAKTSSSRFQRKKNEKQLEKEQRRQAQAQLLEDQRAKRAAELQAALDAEATEALRAAKEEAALNELRAEKRRAEEEDYKKWVGHIEVAEKGEIGSADAAEQALRQYLAYAAAKEKKMLVLEECAKQHSVSVERLLKIMNDMLGAGQISGVFDDRGKFVYVTDEEYAAIAKFIRNRGRVSMHELVRECNRIVAA